MATVKPIDDTDYVPPKNTAIGASNTKSLLPGVQAEIAAEIASQVAPLSADLTTLQNRQANALADIGNIYSGLQTQVQGSTEALRGDYASQQEMQRSVMNEAQGRLAALNSQRASDAQNLAQLLGVNVPLDSLFTAPVSNEQSLFTSEAANRLLSSSQLAGSNLAAAEAFSGRVFPLLRAEDESKTRRAFDEEITKRKKEIATIKGTKKGLVNQRLRERLTQDRQYQLDRAQANRNWWLGVKGLELEKDRITAELASTNAQLADANAARNTTVSENAKDRAIREKLQRQQRAGESAKYRNTIKGAIQQVVQAAISPGADIKEITVAVPAQPNDPDGYRTPTGEFVKDVKQKQNFGAQPISNPNQLLSFIFSRVPGLDRKKNPKLYKYAIQVMKDAYAVQGLLLGEDWVPGAAAPWQTPSTGETYRGGKPTGIPSRNIPGRAD